MTVAGRIVLPSAEPTYSVPTLSAGPAPAVGATLTVYLTGTTTFAAIFTSSALTTAASNPQTANAAGYFYSQSTSLWADASVGYDYVLTLPDGEMYQYANQFLLGPQSSASGFAPINSPTFTGNPQAPTPAANNASASLATTQFVATALLLYAPLVSPAFTGAPTAPTQAPGDTSTKLATDAFVAAAITAAISGNQQIVAGARVTIAGTTLSVGANVGFSSIVRSSAGAYNFTFSTPQADINYRLAASVENSTQLAAMVPPSNKTTAGFAISVLTYNNISNDPSGLSVTVFR